jgi:hypothetical protein
LISPTSEAHIRLQEWTRKVSSVRDVMRGVWCLDLRHNPFTWQGLESALRHPALEYLQELNVNDDSPDELASLFEHSSLKTVVNGIPVAALKANSVQDIDVGVLSAARLQFATRFLSPCTSLQSLKVSLEGYDPDMTQWMRLLEVIVHVTCSHV